MGRCSAVGETVADPGYRVVDSLPLVLRMAFFMQRAGIRGGYRLQEMARARGWLDLLIRFRLPNGIGIDIPANSDSYDLGNIAGYEAALLELLARRVSELDEPVLLLDCGADIGLFSAHMVSSCSRIERVIAFEPNPRSFERLVRNLELLPVRAAAMNMAVADFNGTGELRHPPHDGDDHAAYLAPLAGGDVEVARIDDLGLPAGYRILMKIDVEGGELAAVQGALGTLSSSRQFNVVFEAHRAQVVRTGIDPLKILSLLEEVRPCSRMVAEDPGREIDPGRPFFEQFPGDVYNICVFSE